MSTKNGVVDWVVAQPSRSFFTNHDVPGSVRAVESSLSRLAGSTGPIERVRQGLYWKKPSQTRFGTGRPDPTDAAFAVAGPGAGLAGASAANALGLSTQVSRQPMIAVVGQCPKGLRGVQFTSRSNPQRIKLSQLEVTLLEVLRDFPNHSELTWSAVRARVRRLVRDGRVDLTMVASVAASERRPGLTDRIADLASG
ncbi:MAG: hypothetical protein ACYC06_05225 [Ilumatobacteraceae bacterium]